MGDYKRALEELLRASDIVDDPLIYEHLGDTYLKLKRNGEAVQAWRKCLAIDKQDKQDDEGVKERVQKKLKALGDG
jgi:tetratricopeptide (TPR) repeat protein